MDDVIIDYLFNDEDDQLRGAIQVVVDEIANPDHYMEHRQPVRNRDYVEVTVPRYNVTDFKNHFRMSRESLEQLTVHVANHLPLRHSVPVEKQVLFSVWFLAKQESFLATGDRFGISSGNGHYIFINFIGAVCQLRHAYIQWPNQDSCNEIATRIEYKYGIPGVVGAIDGTHVQIKQPTHNPIDFFNRKDIHSIILQAVCDDNLLFTDIFVGMPGRLHDARVFRNSPIYQRLVDNPPLLPPNQHILGDAAYPLMQTLLKPYRDNGHLNEIQVRFNQTMSACRAMIERAFALLKGKWRRLKYLDMSLQDKIPQTILAACILHNFILKHDNYNMNAFNDDDDVDHIEDMDFEFNYMQGDNQGAIKRDYIASLL
ncbi:hypothetical protein NQ318_018262 [Aromia moschata]|uniref:DDE Tnp4 domain-containing protein n=1 Tax=Aromia moschata TaxID=1265417 RepID=A0AAV8ZFW1_9CUCU|nr:hypothetical protein NQ318_018262 [Aromia moschata]